MTWRGWRSNASPNIRPLDLLVSAPRLLDVIAQRRLVQRKGPLEVYVRDWAQPPRRNVRTRHHPARSGRWLPRRTPCASGCRRRLGRRESATAPESFGAHSVTFRRARVRNAPRGRLRVVEVEQQDGHDVPRSDGNGGFSLAVQRDRRLDEQRRALPEHVGNGRLWAVRRPLREGRCATELLRRLGQGMGPADEAC